MRFEQLRSLDATLRTGSLGRAAVELRLSTPSVSQQVQKLEEELDVVLLVRTATGVAPTAECQDILPYIRAALQAEQGIFQESAALKGVRSGRIRLGAVGLPTRLLLPAVVQRFLEEYPGVAFQAYEGNTTQIADQVASGDLDVGIVSHLEGDAVDERFATRDILAGIKINLCVPEGHEFCGRTAVDVTELEGEDCIAFNPGHLMRKAFDRVSDQASVSIVYYTNSSDVARIMVAAKIGIAIVTRPASLDSPEVVSGRAELVGISATWASASLSLIRRHNEQPTPAVRALTAIIDEEAATLLPGIGR